MNKELRILLNEEQVDKLDKTKEYFREKTYKKTIIRVLEDFIRINNL